MSGSRVPLRVPSCVPAARGVPTRGTRALGALHRVGGPPEAGEARTSVATPGRRVQAALVARRRSEPGPVADLVGALGRWLAAFDPRSIVEPGYASVSDLFTWDELDNDRSAREVQEAVEALGSGD